MLWQASTCLTGSEDDTSQRVLHRLLHHLLQFPSRGMMRRPETLRFESTWWLWFESTHSHQIPERNQRVEQTRREAGFLLGAI